MFKKKALNWLLLCSLIAIAILSSCKPPPDDSVALMENPPHMFIGTPWAVLNLGDWLRLRWIPGLPSILGSDEEDDKLARKDEFPQKEITIPGFWIMGGEVSNEEYINCENAGVCSAPETKETGPLSQYRDPEFLKHPVVGVDWFQSQTYCEWVEGRLPTEAEWEKAARGYGDAIYPWGSDPMDCALLNKKDCMEEDGTMPVASYPGGVSPFDVADMLGNVREWVFDWYTPEGYVKHAKFSPFGSGEGELKVVRGGGFNDFEENLRTTARVGYPPKSSYEDVGFRCVIKPIGYAGMCNPEYEPLCRDPEIPPRDEPCDPEEEAPSDEGVSISSFGCPEDGVVCILFDTGGMGVGGFTVRVDGGESWSCSPSAMGEDLLECCGPEQTMGSTVQVSICQGSELIELTETVYQPSTSGIALAKAFKFDPGIKFQSIDGICPDGYAVDASGLCIPIISRDCREGYRLDSNGICVPESEGECPEGSTYNEKTNSCDGAELCPPGYYYNPKTRCCQPLKGDNYDCPPGFFFNPRYQKCLPIDGFGCPFGSLYDGFGNCLPSPYVPPEPLNGSPCPEGLVELGPDLCGHPDYTETIPEPGMALRPGDSEDGDGIIFHGPDVDDGPIPMMPGSADGMCPFNYYWDPEQERCRPTNGPGSPCPRGYVYNPRTRCCAPAPGFEGARCPELEVADGEPLPDPDPTFPADSFFDVFFDIQLGICDPLRLAEIDEPCPPGYIEWHGHCIYPARSDEGEVETEEGLVPLGECIGDDCTRTEPGDEGEVETEEGLVPLFPCVGDECTRPDPVCEPYEYYDRILRYCVPLQEDCCPLGWDYSRILGECAPVRIVPMGAMSRDESSRECPEGYEMVGRFCLLIGRTEGGTSCWTFDVNVPTCIGPCKVGTTYNPTTGECEEPSQPTDPCAGVNCDRYGPNDCPSNCCTLDPSGGKCIPK